MKNLIGLLIVAFAILWALVAERAFAQVTAQDLMAAGMPAEQASTVAGVFTGGAVVGNNAYIQARNAANSGNNQLLKSDSSDNTIVNAPSGSSAKLSVAGTPHAVISSTGVAVTEDITYAAGSAPRLAPYTATMATTPVAGTNDFKIGVNAVPTAAANTAALMPTPAAAGQMVTVINTGPNAVRVKPGGTNTINDGSAGAYIPLATGAIADCISSSTSAWRCGTRAVPTPAGP